MEVDVEALKKKGLFAVELAQITQRIKELDSNTNESIDEYKKVKEELLDLQKRFDPMCKNTSLKSASEDLWLLKNKVQSLINDLTYVSQQANISNQADSCFKSFVEAEV